MLCHRFATRLLTTCTTSSVTLKIEDARGPEEDRENWWMLPLKYLGVPISDSPLTAGAFNPIIQKMEKRLDLWNGGHLTSGGKQILTNSCLSSIALYCMGFYNLQDSVHKQMHSIRAKFLWQGAKEKFRYHMAKWEMVCRPKDQGGLGIIDTRIINDCLLVKWIWKIFQEPNELWFQVVKAKYMNRGDSLILILRKALNFGKDYIRLNIFSNGVLCSKLKMVILVDFGRIAG